MKSSIFRINDIHWIFFYFIVVISWIGIFLMILEANHAVDLENFYGAELWATLCKPVESYRDWPYSFLMWALMGVAMMVPTIQPTLQTYDDLVNLGEAPKLGFLFILLGFILIWLFFAVAASFLQVFLTEQSILNSDGQFISPVLSVIVLFLAALYQLTGLKKACLNRCRHPFIFFLQSWNGRYKKAFFIGLRIGLFCLGCCWLLMMLAFVGGVMNIGFMAIVTLIMIAEKVPKFGNYVTFPLSFLLLISGSFVAISEFS